MTQIENISYNNNEYGICFCSHGHTRSILIEKFFNIFIFSAVGTCVAAHWNENYIKIMCKYNNQVNMNRLYCQSLSTLSIYSLYHCVCVQLFLLFVAFLFRISMGRMSFMRLDGRTGIFFHSLCFVLMCPCHTHFCNCSSGIRVLLSLALLLLWLNFIVFGHNESGKKPEEKLFVWGWATRTQAFRLKRKLFYLHISAKEKFQPDCKTEDDLEKLNFITCQLQNYAYNLTMWTAYSFSYNFLFLSRFRLLMFAQWQFWVFLLAILLFVFFCSAYINWRWSC